MAKKMRFVLKQSCISELRVNYIDNHASDLQFAIQVQLVQELCHLCGLVFGRKISINFCIIDIATIINILNTHLKVVAICMNI